MGSEIRHYAARDNGTRRYADNVQPATSALRFRRRQQAICALLPGSNPWDAKHLLYLPPWTPRNHGRKAYLACFLALAELHV